MGTPTPTPPAASVRPRTQRPNVFVMAVLYAIRWESMAYNRRSRSIKRRGASGTDGKATLPFPNIPVKHIPAVIPAHHSDVFPRPLFTPPHGYRHTRPTRHRLPPVELTPPLRYYPPPTIVCPQSC